MCSPIYTSTHKHGTTNGHITSHLVSRRRVESPLESWEPPLEYIDVTYYIILDIMLCPLVLLKYIRHYMYSLLTSVTVCITPPHLYGVHHSAGACTT